MKTIIFIIISFFIIQSINGQERKFSNSIEYSPHFSKLTNEIVEEKFKVSHHLLFRTEYNTKFRIKPTIGIGIFNTGMLISEEGESLTTINGNPPIVVSRVTNNYFSFNYLIIPVGAKIEIGKYYLRPEISIGYNVRNQIVSWTTESTGDITVEWEEQMLINGAFNPISFPLSLGFGRNYSIGMLNLSAGLKSYVSLNQLTRGVPRNTRYYGFGLLLAAHF